MYIKTFYGEIWKYKVTLSFWPLLVRLEINWYSKHTNKYLDKQTNKLCIQFFFINLQVIVL